MLSVVVLVTSVFAIISAKSNFYQQNRGANDQTPLLLIDATEVDKLFSVPGKRVRLTGNPIACICDNKALLDSLRTNQNQIDDYESITCVGGDHDGETISRLDLANLCEFPLKLVITIAVLTAICVFVIIMLIFIVVRLVRANTVRERARVIVLGDVSEQKNLNSDLREFLQVNTYVQWDDPKFFDKLKEQLK